jgi:chromosome segregation ATPase
MPESSLQIITAVAAPVLSFFAAILAYRSQRKDSEHELVKIQDDIRRGLWAQAKDELDGLRAELDAERQSRRELAQVVEALRARISELEAENRRLRADNVALTAELGRYTGRKL